MKLAMDRLKPVAIDVCVMLGRANIGMAQQLLHGTQVGAAGQEVRRKTVAQGMRADFGVEAARAHIS